MTFIATPKLADEAGRLAALYRYQILDTEPEREFAEVIRLVRTLFGVPMVAISLLDKDRQWFKDSVGIEGPGTPRSVAFCDHTIRGTKAMEVEDARADPRFAANPLVTGGPGIRCYLGVPLTTPEGYNVGALCVIGTEPRSFTAADSDLLAGFARLVVSQMELRMLARRDLLTGALTRRAFEEAMRAASDEAQAGGAPVSLLLLDIDHFKAINDRWGHPAGDRVLATLAEAIHEELRPLEAFGRIGGEEFGILVRDTGNGTAWTRAEAIRQRVAALRLPALYGAVVTVSCGVAPWQPAFRQPERWLSAADVALYAAKRGGRDRVVLAA